MGNDPVPSSLTLVWQQNIPTAMQRIGGLLEEALDNYGAGEVTMQNYYEMLLRGQAHLWLLARPSGSIDLAAITRIVVYPAQKALSIDLIAGKNMEEAVKFLGPVERWAAELGCTRTEAWVRPGITRVMSKYGFEKKYEVITRPIARSLN